METFPLNHLAEKFEVGRSVMVKAMRNVPPDVFWQTGKLPKGMWIPDQGVAPYRGRG